MIFALIWAKFFFFFFYLWKCQIFCLTPTSILLINLCTSSPRQSQFPTLETKISIIRRIARRGEKTWINDISSYYTRKIIHAKKWLQILSVRQQKINEEDDVAENVMKYKETTKRETDNFEIKISNPTQN